MWVVSNGQCHDLLASLFPEHPFNPSPFLSKAVGNVIASLIYARRFEYEDPFFNGMLKTLKESFGEENSFIAEVCSSEQRTGPPLCYKSYGASMHEFSMFGSQGLV